MSVAVTQNKLSQSSDYRTPRMDIENTETNNAAGSESEITEEQPMILKEKQMNSKCADPKFDVQSKSNSRVLFPVDSVFPENMGTKSETKIHLSIGSTKLHDQESACNACSKSNAIPETTCKANDANLTSAPPYSTLTFPDSYSTGPAIFRQCYPYGKHESLFPYNPIYKPNGLGPTEAAHCSDSSNQSEKPSASNDNTNFVHLENNISLSEYNSIYPMTNYNDDRPTPDHLESDHSNFAQSNFLDTNKEHFMPLMLKKTFKPTDSCTTADNFSSMTQSEQKDDTKLIGAGNWFSPSPTAYSFEVSRNPVFPVFRPSIHEFGRHELCESAAHQLVNSTPYSCHRPQSVTIPNSRSSILDRKVPPNLRHTDDSVDYEAPTFNVRTKITAPLGVSRSVSIGTEQTTAVCHRDDMMDPSLMVPFQAPPLFMPPPLPLPPPPTTELSNPFISYSTFPKSETDEMENPKALNSVPWAPGPGTLNFGQNINPPMELNTARRRNATRESTNTLKMWLQEHINNPYPTKGEKIMLAVITKMTLTQVSTWFANARRRLKKENKMTWTPKHRGEEFNEDGLDEGPGSEDDQEIADDDALTDSSAHSQDKPGKPYCAEDGDYYGQQQMQGRPAPKRTYSAGRDHKYPRNDSRSCSDSHFQSRSTTTTASTTIATYSDTEQSNPKKEVDFADRHTARSDSSPSAFLRRSLDGSGSESPIAKMRKLSPTLLLSTIPSPQHPFHQSQHFPTPHPYHHQRNLDQHQRPENHPCLHVQYDHPEVPRVTEVSGAFNLQADSSKSTPTSPKLPMHITPLDRMQNQTLEPISSVQYTPDSPPLHSFGHTGPDMNHNCWPVLLPRSDAPSNPINSSNLNLVPLASIYGGINHFNSNRIYSEPNYSSFPQSFETWRTGQISKSINSLLNGNADPQYATPPVPSTDPFYQRLCGIQNSFNLFGVQPTGGYVETDKYQTRFITNSSQPDGMKNTDSDTPVSGSSPRKEVKSNCSHDLSSASSDFVSRSHSPRWIERLVDERRAVDLYDSVQPDALTATTTTSTGSPLHSSNSSSTPAFGFSTSPKPGSLHESQTDDIGVWSDFRQTTTCPPLQRSTTDAPFFSLSSNPLLPSNVDM